VEAPIKMAGTRAGLAVRSRQRRATVRYRVTRIGSLPSGLPYLRLGGGQQGRPCAVLQVGRAGPMGGDSELRGRASGLLDRSGECAVLDQLIDAVRAGKSQVLVVCGEPGVGKSALLDYLAGTRRGAG
jgi:hypothetical protein